MGTLTIAKQDCYLELRHNGSLVEYVEIPAGGEIELRNGNGFRTVVRTTQRYNDERAAFGWHGGFAEYFTPEQVKAAQDRIDRHESGENVYGDAY